jgi:hypothetical protein
VSRELDHTSTTGPLRTASVILAISDKQTSSIGQEQLALGKDAASSLPGCVDFSHSSLPNDASSVILRCASCDEPDEDIRQER